MHNYDEARSLADLCVEKLLETQPLKATATQYEEALDAAEKLRRVIAAEQPREAEVPASNSLSLTGGAVLSRGVKDVETLVLNPGDEAVFRVFAKAGVGNETERLLTAGTVALEKLAGDGLRLFSTVDDVTYWECGELAENGYHDFIFRARFASDETGFVEPVAGLVHAEYFDNAADRSMVNASTLDVSDSQVKVITGGLSDIVVGTTVGSVLDASFSSK